MAYYEVVVNEIVRIFYYVPITCEGVSCRVVVYKTIISVL